MRMFPLLFALILIECSVCSPVLNCNRELESLKEMATAKASLIAALSGRQLQIISALEQVNSIDIQTKEGDSLLILAAENGLTNVVTDLLNLNTITVSNAAIKTASQQAQGAGFPEVVEILRNSTKEVNFKQ